MTIIRLLMCLLKLLVVSIPLQLIGMVILIPAVIQSHIQGTNKLPVYARWFDNADIYNGRNSDTYLQVVKPKGILYQYYWLAIRNPANYFGYYYMGFTVKQQPDVKNAHIEQFEVLGGTFNSIIIPVDGIIRYDYSWVYTWNSGKQTKLWWGWKIKDVLTLNSGCPVEGVMQIKPYV